MKNIITAIFALLLSNVLAKAQEKYFQQKADVTISCTLNDRDHTLTGSIEINYQNNSPDALDRLAFHLWPNAYTSSTTAFGRQKLLNRDTKFHDATKEQRGFLKMNGLTADGQPVSLEEIKNNPDMAWMNLPQVLLPGKKTSIKGTFILKIPNTFSRLGHVGQTYQITQWYLKPAVYDRKGWHLMPYLDQGEFYADFGTYKVEITLPENYVVAASGMLQDSVEMSFLQDRLIKTPEQQDTKDSATRKEIISSAKLKTLHFIAENVHDFAWFADKEFMVGRTEVILPSGRKIYAWAYYDSKKHWPRAAEFAARAVRFYSEKVGEYPWPQVSVVHSALSAGGGMEYPMITVINDVNSERTLDQLVTHEVGHNWFQGILATNERDHPWMDEGINSYYEQRYMENYYKDYSLINIDFGKVSRRLPSVKETEILYQPVSHLNLDQFPDQTSANFNVLNYGSDVYFRTASLFGYAEDFMGTGQFDSVMRRYYDLWKFRHPYPEDLQEVYKSNPGPEMDWLFLILGSSKKTDYGIKRVKKDRDGNYLVTLKRKGAIGAPVRLSGMLGDSTVYSEWIEGFSGTKTIISGLKDADRFVIDKDGKYYDYNMRDNTMNTRGAFRALPPLKVGLTGFYNSKDHTSVLVYPSFHWNRYDGGMLGLSLRKPLIPRDRWFWSLSPKYAFRSGYLAGTAEVNYRINLNQGPVDFVKIGVRAKEFAFQDFDQSHTNRYTQAEPFITINMKGDLAAMTTSKFRISLFAVSDLVHDRDSSAGKTFISAKRNNYFIPKASYYYSNPSIISPRSFQASLYFERYKTVESRNAKYARVDLEYKRSWRWSKRRYFDTRWATTFFPVNTERDRHVAARRSDASFIRGTAGAAFQGYHDYANEYDFLGRSAADGLWSQQIEIVQGGMKIAPGVAQKDNLGNTNQFLAAMNLSTDLPIKRVGRILRPYFDLVFVKPVDGSVSANWLYSGGLELNIIPRFFEIYFPLIHSKEISEIYKSNGGSYFRQVCFSMRFKFDHIRDIANFVQ